jgi:hypothetical protein
MSELGDKFRQFRDRQNGENNKADNTREILKDFIFGEYISVPLSWNMDNWPNVRVIPTEDPNTMFIEPLVMPTNPYSWPTELPQDDTP